MPRDPLDTNLSAMIDQAQSVAVQLRVVQPARDALPAIGADADALAASVEAAASVAADAQAAADTAEADLAWAVAHDGTLRQDALGWVRALRDALRVVSAEPAMRSWADQLAAALPHAHTRREGLLAAVDQAWTLLTDPASPLSNHPALAGSRAKGAEAAPPLLAHARARAEIARVAKAASVTRAAARADLLATLRAARATWRAAAACAPGAIPDLDLRLVAAAATARRSRPPSPGVPDDPMPDPIAGVSRPDRDPSDPASAAPAPSSDPSDLAGRGSAGPAPSAPDAPCLDDDGPGDRLQIHILHQRD
jgi:hypothetical protein